jgi:cysteine desulfurase
VPRAYLDAAAVAPLHPAARQALLAALDDGWADPRRLHREGRLARLLLDGAREKVAGVLGARTEEVGFTGSHARAVHAAVAGVAHARRRTGRRVVVSAVEHSAVLHAADHAAAGNLAAPRDEQLNDLIAAPRVPVDRAGRVDVAAFADRVRGPGVALACLQAANGEVGTVQPVPAAAEACRQAGVPLLVDAAASCGHTPTLPGWDLLTADPRAWGGPAGVGVLAIRAGTRWLPTEPEHDGVERLADDPAVPLALAAAAALEAVDAGREAEGRRRRELLERVRAAAAAVPDTDLAGDGRESLPHVLTFSCLYVDGEVLLGQLDHAGFAVGSGSACTASTLEPSHVLAAMGLLTHGNVRVGLPVGVAAADVDAFCAALPGAVAAVRAKLGAGGL